MKFKGINQIQMRQGGGGQKNPKILQTSYLESSLRLFPPPPPPAPPRAIFSATFTCRMLPVAQPEAADCLSIPLKTASWERRQT